MLIPGVNRVLIWINPILDGRYWHLIINRANKTNWATTFPQLHYSCCSIKVKSVSGGNRDTMVSCPHVNIQVRQVWVQVQCGVSRLKLSHILNVTHGLNRVPARCLCLPKLFVHPHRQIYMCLHKTSPNPVHEERHWRWITWRCLINSGFC